MEGRLTWADAPGHVVVHDAEGKARGGLVMLHGASDGRARQPLFDQVAHVLGPMGVTILSYERRRAEDGDTPLRVQAADAIEAMRALRADLDCPVGVFGFSQGAWAATLAAADEIADYLIVLGCSGVSPADQMRFHADELLRRHGFSESDRSRTRHLRAQYEEFLRAATPSAARRIEFAAALREAAGEPWSEHAFLPREPPAEGITWPDMDFDPAPSFQQPHIPVLAIWGADEECVPPQPSRDAWLASGTDVTLVDLPGCGHWPVAGSGAPGYGGWETDQLSEHFTACLATWLDHALPPQA